MATTSAEIMTSPAISVTPETGIAEIAALLSQKKISAVPVCKADGTLVGIVSEGDILRPFRESVRQRQDWWLGILSEGEELSQSFLDYLRRDTRTANDLMSRAIVTTDETATVPQLADLMLTHGVKRLPVLREGRLIGIVSRADLVAAIARAPAMLV